MTTGKVTRYDQARRVHLGDNIARPDHRLVLISKEALGEMYAHAVGEMHHEVGGYLLGLPIVDHETNVEATYIETAVRAVYDSTPTYITMHAESLARVESVRQAANTILVGYYHSHPRLTVFQSTTDVRNFQLYHSENYQIAVVVDPSSTSEDEVLTDGAWIGYFAWDKDSSPVRLAAENITIVENRPKAADDEEVTGLPEVTLEQVSSEKLEPPAIESARVGEETESLKLTLEEVSPEIIEPPALESPQFEPGLPIIKLPDTLGRYLFSKKLFPSDRLLFGTIEDDQHHTVIQMRMASPTTLRTLREYNKTARKALKQNAGRLGFLCDLNLGSIDKHTSSARLVGILVGDDASLELVTTVRRNRRIFPWNRTDLADLMLVCGDFFVIGYVDSKESGSKIRFRFWKQDERRFAEIPEHHVITIPGEIG